jgi:hypothetical protein
MLRYVKGLFSWFFRYLYLMGPSFRLHDLKIGGSYSYDSDRKY